jgi:succinoglycan biosynthesis protein ExoA
MPFPTAAVIVAALDEVANIDHVIDTALASRHVATVIVADGGSTDGTRERVAHRAHADPRVRLIDNPHRVQSAGLNVAATIADTDLLIRLDGHTTYAPDYIDASVAAWAEDLAVGGPMRARGDTPWSEATAYAMDDPMAIGPARFHHATVAEDVDTVYLGTFERAVFLDVGGFRTFPSGTVEDTDFYRRWRERGGIVRVDPAVRSWYHPRSKWRGLWRQYVRYGRGKAELLWLNGRLPSVRPAAPAALVLLLAVGAVLAVSWTPWPLVALIGVWGLALGVVAARSPARRLRTAAAAATMHVAYGLGLWIGVFAGRPEVHTLGMPEPASRT